MFADVASPSHGMDPDEIGAAIWTRSYSCLFNLRKLFIYADFGFWNGEFSQKIIRTIYLQRKFKRYSLGKAGYYNELVKHEHDDLAHITITLSVNCRFQALIRARSLGSHLQNSFQQNFFFADQGIFLSIEIQRARRRLSGI